MKLTILGTGSACPTIDRNHSATALNIGPETLLFDCGESTQLQLTKAGISHSKISKIFLTHWHGDHMLGLPGLLQSMELNKRAKPLNIYGSAGSKDRFRKLVSALEIKLSFKVNVTELKAGAFNSEKYSIIVANASHHDACISYAFQEKDKVRIDIGYLKKFGLKNNPIIGDLAKGKDIVWNKKKIKAKDATKIEKGKRFAYVLDSAYAENLVKLAKDSDVLLCESTFADELKDSAKKFGHMTARDAATLAKKAGAKKLIITHFSQRYKDVSVLLREAKSVFKGTIAAKDLMEIEL